MGAIPYPGGVTFRLWAPNAETVAVHGTFDGWAAGGTPLAPDGESGHWSVDVAGAGPRRRVPVPGLPGR
ncbi:MAG: hypothetical protein U0869_06310 [Chloroflexota bacterium]